jgi:RNA polymerase sigma-70 factor (ECF subfamily)
MAAPPTTEPLLAAFLAGRPGAADALVGRYRPLVRAALARFLALRCRGRLDLAEDLTHEVFVALLHDDGAKLRGFEGRNGCSLAGWLRVVAVRLAIDRLRRDRRLVSMDDDSQRMQELRRGLRTDEPDPEQALAGAELAEDLRRAVADLPPKDRLLVELHLVRGAALDEVAGALGVTPNAVYVRKHRVLERLRRRLRGTP